MRIETNAGTVEANWTLEMTTRSGAAQLAMEIDGQYAPATIVSTLNGQNEIREIDEAGNVKMYTGYCWLASLYYSHDRSTARVTLERV